MDNINETPNPTASFLDTLDLYGPNMTEKLLVETVAEDCTVSVDTAHAELQRLISEGQLESVYHPHKEDNVIYKSGHRPMMPGEEWPLDDLPF
ncbi:hypothetical protein [Deinococcus cellulosilyticus]|uniref:Uncharacterized protein n=1 Tax=Deinococcus cellulosilyticus (strain DSM 18568 / NBRC 106333 / KACC 11606 / 5516J-15) TaxID=1223518 RepID=A0A511NB67_DEIC1|nr:hypothetical protein [Deinococcus cellulosilyticus]GEM49631.1 hypothetical protein DC3_52660 [Deinococcus cellulosilyticus NBRC 106333 = KACC 11606]